MVPHSPREGSTASTYDLIISNSQVVRPGREAPEELDIAVSGGTVTALGREIPSEHARQVIDGSGLLAFPGAVDAHCHWGIYNPLEEDAVSESRAALQGGVTSALTYFRTGQYYLNKSGPYEEFFPEVLERSEGRAHIDYGYHLAPMMRQHIDEIPLLVERFGVTSFKIFMFYGGHGLHGRSDDQSSFLMTPPGESYDLAHFELIMRGVEEARSRYPDLAEQISLSLHCENAEIMRYYTELVEQEADLRGLAAYSAARPPHSEGLAIFIAAYLAHATGLPTINLLHLSSAAAVEAALLVRDALPDIDFRREVTIGHLIADIESANGLYAKVNPPIRPREDVEALWSALLARDIDWVVSDHACCKEATKLGPNPDDVWAAKSGFGGTEYLLSALFSEGTRRGLSPNRIAELVSWNPSRRFGLPSKGDIAEGLDADIVLFDPDEKWVVRASESESRQGYSPFEGFELTGRVKQVFLRGRHVLDNGKVIGSPQGQYLHRTTRTP